MPKKLIIQSLWKFFPSIADELPLDAEPILIHMLDYDEGEFLFQFDYPMGAQIWNPLTQEHIRIPTSQKSQKTSRKKKESKNYAKK